MVVERIDGNQYIGPQVASQRYGSLAGASRGGKTTMYILNVPRFSSELKIHISTSSPGCALLCAIYHCSCWS